MSEVGPVPLTRQAAQRLQGLAEGELSPEVRRKAAVCLLDYVSACIGGLTAPWAPAVLAYAATRGGAPQSHLWGSSHLVAAEDAAFGNGALGHSLIRDDMHLLSSSHIGVLVLPAVLAAAQREHLSGQALVRGIVAGYEMAVRLGTAVQFSKAHSHFRPSGINGPFGAAAAVAVAVGADEDTTAAALGFAANAASGLNEWPWAGGQEVNTHAGLAARNGLAAFDLARAGLRPSDTVLEGRDGLFAAYGDQRSGTELFMQGLAQPVPGILDVTFKPYPGCNLIQTPITAALLVHARLAGGAHNMADIEQVVIGTFEQAQAYPGCDNTGPLDTVQQTKMSLQYGVCSALLYGRVDEQTYTRFADPDLQRLIAGTTITVEQEHCTALLELRQSGRVEVRLTDGTVLGVSVDDVPWLDEAAVEQRLRGVAADVIPPAELNRMIDLVGRLWDLPDCNELFAVFASAISSPG